MNEMQITLTFSDADFDVIDLTAKLLKRTRDDLIREMFADAIQRHVKEQIGELREVIKLAKFDIRKL